MQLNHGEHGDHGEKQRLGCKFSLLYWVESGGEFVKAFGQSFADCSRSLSVIPVPPVVRYLCGIGQLKYNDFCRSDLRKRTQ